MNFHIMLSRSIRGLVKMEGYIKLDDGWKELQVNYYGDNIDHMMDYSIVRKNLEDINEIIISHYPPYQKSNSNGDVSVFLCTIIIIHMSTIS